MLNIQKMMKQAQMVQQKMQEMQERFKEMYVNGQAGDGLVQVEMSCAGVVRSIKINPSIVDASDVETLEDLVIAAVNNASAAKDQQIQESTKSMMEESGLPTNAQLPF